MTAALETGNPTVSAVERAATRPGHLTSEDVWHEIEKASFAIVGYVTPAGEPRSSGVVFKTAGRRLYIAVAPDSWKAKHIEASGRVSVVVPVRRGGILTLVLPIPPATISFHAKAVVHPAGQMIECNGLPRELTSLVPAERRALARIIELSPEAEFVTYGIGVSLMDMKEPALAQARVPVLGESGQRS